MGDVFSSESFSEDEDSEWTDVSDDGEDFETETYQNDTPPDESTPEKSYKTDADNSNDPIAVGVRHLWEENQLRDFTLYIEDHRFQVHRVILAACSNFFREVLSEDSVEDCKDTMRIVGMDAVVVEKLVQFIYTSNLGLNDENVAGILIGARFFQIESAVDTCKQFIAKRDGWFTPVVAHPLRSGLHSVWENDQLLDYTIHVEDQEFKAHKVVLAASSDFFKVMMTGGMTETGKDSVKIEGSVSADTVETLLDIIYTNSFVTDDATEILAGAVYFQMQAAIEICSQFMIGQLDVNNWLEILTVFRSVGLMDSVKEVQGYISSNIREIVETSVFSQLELQYQDLNFFIDNWNGSEHALFLFVKKWVKADVKNRKQYEDKLLCCVRFGLMTPDELKIVKLQEVLNASIKAPKPWYGFLDGAIEYHKLPVHERVIVQSEQTQVRTPPTFIIFPPQGSDRPGCVFGSNETGFLLHHSITSPKFEMTLTEIEVNNFLIVLLNACRKNYPWRIFDPRTLQWSPIASLAVDLSDSCSLSHDNKYMYASGGEMEDKVIDRIDRYDFKTNKWSPFSKLPVPVRSHSTCVVNNRLYVSGGFPEGFIPDLLNVLEYNDACLSRMDCLDLTTLKWVKNAPMLTNRFGHRMHAMKIEGEEVVCLVGHKLDMEYYSPSKNQWFSCSFSFNEPPPSPSYRPVIRGNRVYLIDAFIREGRSKGLGACAVVTFPEEGKEANIDYLYKYRGLFGFFTRSSVLALRPYTQRVPETPVLKTAKGARVGKKK